MRARRPRGGAHPRQRPAGRRARRSSRRSASREAPALPLDVARRDDPGPDRLPAPAGARRASTRRCRPRRCSRACSWPTRRPGVRADADQADRRRSTTRTRRGAWPRERGWDVGARRRPRLAAHGRRARGRCEVLERRARRAAGRAAACRHRRRRRRHPGRAARRAARRARGRDRQGPLRGRAGRWRSAPTCWCCSPACRAWRSTSARAGSARWRGSRSPTRCATSSDGEFPAGQHGAEDRGGRALRRARGGRAVITDAAHLADRGARATHGTWIVPDDDGPSVVRAGAGGRHELGGAGRSATATSTACG